MLRNVLKAAAVVVAVSSVAPLAHADDAMTVSFGKAKFGALLQFWGLNDTSLNAQAKFNMRIRRAEMRASGAVTDSTKWYINIDPAAMTSQQGSTFGFDQSQLLRDAWIAQQVMMPELELQVGEFKQPTVAESLDPSGELMFPERSMIARMHGEQREPGAMLTYHTPMWKVMGAISNGQGINRDDFDRTNAGNTEPKPNNKNLTFRFDVKPMEMFSAGAWAQFKDFSWGQQTAWGMNARLMPIEDLVIRGEFVRAAMKVDPTTAATSAAGVDSVSTVGNLAQTIAQNGYVIDAGYQYGDWQPVARWEMAQNGITTLDSATGTVLTLGLNYYLAKNNSKIQFAYMFLHNVAGSVATGTSTVTPNQTLDASATGNYLPYANRKGGLAVLAFQTAL